MALPKAVWALVREAREGELRQSGDAGYVTPKNFSVRRMLATRASTSCSVL